MMSEALPAGAVKTFSIGFEEPSFDESSHARRVAAHFGTDHHEEVFSPGVMVDDPPDGRRRPRRAVRGRVDPPDVSPLALHPRESVTVALGGDGGDELLAGYPTFPADRLASLYLVPRLLNERVVIPLADRLPVSTRNFSLDFKLKRFLRGAAAPAELRHPLGSARSRPRSRSAARTASCRSVRGAAARCSRVPRLRTGSSD